MTFNTRRFIALLALFNLLVFLAACSTSWVQEASSIIGALVPAVEGVLVILSGLGAVGLSPSVITAVQTWGTQAQNDLENVVTPLINQYNTAEAAAQPGILTQIETALNTITANLKTILPTLKVENSALQAKITAIVTEVSDEFEALLNLIPVVKGAVTPADVMKALAAHPEAVAKLKSAKQFSKDYNAKAGAFGAQYKNWIK
jgi:hypothetical protein